MSGIYVGDILALKKGHGQGSNGPRKLLVSFYTDEIRRMLEWDEIMWQMIIILQLLILIFSLYTYLRILRKMYLYVLYYKAIKLIFWEEIPHIYNK